MAQRPKIPATPDNMVLGYLDAASPPVLTVDSGIETASECLARINRRS